MLEVVEIHRLTDKAIIEALKNAKNRKLLRGEIIQKVKNVTGENDQIIAKRLEKMSKKSCGYLIKPQRGIYELNPKMDFRYVGEEFPSKQSHIEIPPEIRRAHTSQLKEAINIWKNNIPEPEYFYPFSRNYLDENFLKSEQHILFQDLRNHLPIMGFDILDKWDAYKAGLMKLKDMECSLVTSIEKEILKTFDGLKLNFIYGFDHSQEQTIDRDYDCVPFPQYIYMHLIAYNKGIDCEDEVPVFEFFLDYSSLSKKNKIYEEDCYIYWGDKYFHYIRLPKDERIKLDVSINKFLSFYENIQNSRFVDEANNIVKTVQRLRQERTLLIQELEKPLLYASFSGDCEYLG